MRPTPTGEVTCDYGVRGSWAAGFHTGRDYRAAVGTPIQATMRGRVIYVGWSSWGEAYGLHVVVECRTRKGREIHVGYCHLKSAAVVQGTFVQPGRLLGHSGETGRTFGPHLHYEERIPPHRYNERVREPRFPGVTRAVLRRWTLRRRSDHPNAARRRRRKARR